jgi:hypothetical protein
LGYYYYYYYYYYYCSYCSFTSSFFTRNYFTAALITIWTAKHRSLLLKQMLNKPRGRPARWRWIKQPPPSTIAQIFKFPLASSCFQYVDCDSKQRDNIYCPWRRISWMGWRASWVLHAESYALLNRAHAHRCLCMALRSNNCMKCLECTHSLLPAGCEALELLWRCSCPRTFSLFVSVSNEFTCFWTITALLLLASLVFNYNSANHIRCIRQKVKAIPLQAFRVPGGWGSHIYKQSAHEGGKVVSPTHRPPL